jgi:hypothetical protein
MAAFALAHMSCGAAWCWDDVAELLRAAGHTVHAPDFDFRPGATPDDHAAQLGDADVFVGHSYGSLPAHMRLRGLSPESRLVVIDGSCPTTATARTGCGRSTRGSGVRGASSGWPRTLALQGAAMPCCVADADTDDVLGAVGVHAIDVAARTAELG